MQKVLFRWGVIIECVSDLFSLRAGPRAPGPYLRVPRQSDPRSRDPPGGARLLPRPAGRGPVCGPLTTRRVRLFAALINTEDQRSVYSSPTPFLMGGLWLPESFQRDFQVDRDLWPTVGIIGFPRQMSPRKIVLFDRSCWVKSSSGGCW